MLTVHRNIQVNSEDVIDDLSKSPRKSVLFYNYLPTENNNKYTVPNQIFLLRIF